MVVVNVSGAMAKTSRQYWTLQYHGKVVDDFVVKNLLGAQDAHDGTVAVNLRDSQDAFGLLGDALSQGLGIRRPRLCDRALLGHIGDLSDASVLFGSFLTQYIEAITDKNSVLGGIYAQYLKDSREEPAPQR